LGGQMAGQTACSKAAATAAMMGNLKAATLDR
jgi:hypothetical protein